MHRARAARQRGIDSFPSWNQIADVVISLRVFIHAIGNQLGFGPRHAIKLRLVIELYGVTKSEF